MGGVLEPVVHPPGAASHLLPHLIGKSQALLGDRRRDRGAVDDLVDEAPKCGARQQAIDELVEQPAVEEVRDQLPAAIALERPSQAALHVLAVVRG